MTDVQDLTLDEVRALLADGIASNAAFDGWGDDARDMAADAAGIDRDIARLAFKDGPVAMIDAWFGQIDQAMVEAVPADRAAQMKIRERITALVEARLAAAAPNREALRRALTILAMPQNAATAARLGWRTVDAIWAQAGDTATDYNHLYQACDAVRRLCLDHRGVPERRERGSRRHPRLPRAPDRGDHAVREVEGGDHQAR